MSDLKYWVALDAIGGLGRVRFGLIETFFPSMEDAWRADRSELRAAGLDEWTCRRIAERRQRVDPDSLMAVVEEHGIHVYTWRDPGYPGPLAEIEDRPPVLFVKGQLTDSDRWSIAVVGTRRATPYGRQVAEQMSTGLSRNGITIVSGLARGIDAIAHRAALQCGGRTVAVLACGLDMMYPPEHLRLAQAITEQGALVSEYPPGTEPRGEYFPRRNRILSGLSLGVLVVEGDVKSGALITARQALEQNREVFSVPGSIYSDASRGTNSLIKDSAAKLVLSVDDILEELNLTMAAHQLEMKELLPSDASESALLEHLSLEPRHIDEVRRSAGLEISEVSSTLAMLELKGLVRQVGTMNYVRTH
ncbi:MAG: DNA-protecting protein DprA [Dehalococcoidia bacterium]|nr:DNA-protecting protein DprA [Dehalococcoidia bacterium]